MADVVDLQGRPIPTREDLEFVTDMARFAEGITEESAIRKKYRLAEEVWNALGEDDDLVRSITEEKLRRIRNGLHKREKAQALIVKGPAILDSIASDVSASPRHRVDAIKTLDGMAANGPEGAAAGALFQITINLGADHVEHYSKTIAINADSDDVSNTTEPNSRPQLTAIATSSAAKTPEDDALAALMLLGE
jgi:hypothetical protein